MARGTCKAARQLDGRGKPFYPLPVPGWDGTRVRWAHAPWRSVAVVARGDVVLKKPVRLLGEEAWRRDWLRGILPWKLGLRKAPGLSLIGININPGEGRDTSLPTL